MSDHAISIFSLVIAAIAGLAEIAIFWMILQDYRKARGVPELPTRRLLVLSALSLGPLIAIGAAWWLGGPRNNGNASTDLCKCQTRLRLSFDANGVAHTVDPQNVFHWFAFWHTWTYKTVEQPAMR